MGMLIRRHRDRHKTEGAEAQEQVADTRTRGELRAEAKALGLPVSGTRAELVERIAAHLEAEGKAPDPEVSPYADLTDEQVAEAYAMNVDPEDFDPEHTPSREDMVAALEALDAEDGTEPDPGAGGDHPDAPAPDESDEDDNPEA